jgi:hypothetical protein
MDIKPTHNPLKPVIEIELLKFKEGVRHIDISLERGHINKEQAHSQMNGLASIYADHIASLVRQGTAVRERRSSRAHRYLVQFRRRGYFTTDCGFHQGQFDLAKGYVRIVVDTLDEVAEGIIFDTKSHGVAYRYVRPEDHEVVLEEQVVAVFGEREEFRDPNGSDGVDDDPFVKYSGTDDPEIRYR